MTVEYRIRPREEWLAKPPKGTLTNIKLPVPELWLHHTVTPVTSAPNHDARVIQQVAFNRGFSDISYTRLFHPTGVILEGRDYHKVGAHTAGHNSVSFGYAVIGNTNEQAMTPELIEAVRWCIYQDKDNRAIQDKVFPSGGHRDLKATACPGNHAYAALDQLRVPWLPSTQENPNPTLPEDWTEAMLMALPTLKRGDNANINRQYVKNLQGLLVAANRPLTVDGEFGPGTESALRGWQSAAGVTADGICGERTWRVLLGA